jgi:hypothetical protein
MNHSLAAELKAITPDEPRYHRNVLYITPAQQAKIKQTRILFAGVGLGSVLAEAALRLGFENLIFIDGDTVEMTNLNRQNYRQADIGQTKVGALKAHLLGINPAANIQTEHLFLSSAESIAQHVKHCDIAINAIDFDDNRTPFVFDEVCHGLGIPVVHPLNFGWAGAAYVVTPDSEQLYNVPRTDGRFELVLVESFFAHFRHQSGIDIGWWQGLLADYARFANLVSPPQLSVGSYLTAGIVTDILFCLANELPIKTFPEPYFVSAR